ncbi:hypothetical protein AVEN_100519-1, partial [Araneus ventricosus]
MDLLRNSDAVAKQAVPRRSINIPGTPKKHYRDALKALESDLTSDEYADKIRALIDDTKTFNNVEHYGVNVTVQEDHGTSHLSIIAPNGDAVSVTSTVNA